MTFIRHAIRFLFSIYNVILTVVLLTMYFVMVFWIKIDMINSNVTWVYSSSMQTLAALIALLPISYGYYINNVDNERSDEYDSYIIERLKRDVYYDMMTVIAFSLIVIILNLLSFFLQYHVISSFVIALLTVEGIGLIALYIYRLFDPRKVREILREFDTNSEIDPNQETVSLDTFITEYLKLETAVKDFLSNENDNELVDTLPLYDIVDNLSKDFPELQEHYDTFKEIIFHRNNLIHNYMDTVVDYSKYAKMLELKELFDRANDAFIHQNVFANVRTIRKMIETGLNEYLLDQQNELVDIGSVLEDYKEDIVSLLHSYFISEYYITHSLEEASEADFEVIQNNYSERKLLGIDVKSITPKKLRSISNRYFERLHGRFMYLFLINFDPDHNRFILMYQTKDNNLRSVIVK